MTACCTCACAGVTAAPSATEGEPQNVYFLPRLGAPAAVAPAVDPAWNGVSSYFARARATRSRVVGDSLNTIAGLARTVVPAGQQVVERQYVWDPFPAGVSFGGVEMYQIMQSASIIGGSMLPVLGLRVVDLSGTIVRATLLPVANYGSGTFLNANGTRLWASNVAGGAVLGAYVSQDGDRLVLEIGARHTGGGADEEYQTVYGSLSTVAGNTHALHVLSTAAEGVNPGSRNPYVEFDFLVPP